MYVYVCTDHHRFKCFFFPILSAFDGFMSRLRRTLLLFFFLFVLHSIWMNPTYDELIPHKTGKTVWVTWVSTTTVLFYRNVCFFFSVILASLIFLEFGLLHISLNYICMFQYQWRMKFFSSMLAGLSIEGIISSCN